MQTVTIDFPRLLRKLTGRRGWEETPTWPGTRGCGLDWFYRSGSYFVWTNVDQERLVIQDAAGETLYSGELGDAGVRRYVKREGA